MYTSCNPKTGRAGGFDEKALIALLVLLILGGGGVVLLCYEKDPTPAEKPKSPLKKLLSLKLI